MTTATLGQRQTRQRETILQVIQTAHGPLSVPEIFERATQTLPGLGIATVYRTLKLLHEGKQIEVVILPTGETRYECAGLGHHDHFQCRSCNQVFDLATCPLHLAHGAKLPGGFIVEDHEMTIYGLCAHCSGLSANHLAKPGTRKISDHLSPPITGKK